jgi:dihydrolipoamide dehydrogenase
MSSANEFDLIVLGAGPAGYSAAVRAAQLGARVLIVEKAKAGGTCLNRGCIPTKFLWESLHLHNTIKRAAERGITAEIREHSYPALREKKNRAVDLLTKSLQRLVESYGITVMTGTAAFTGPNQIAVTAADGTTTEAKADKVIIATGSAPCPLPGLAIDHEKVIDSTDALDLPEVPKTLLVIGGGAIGIEMSSFFSGMGSEVTLMEKEPQLLPGEDAELSEELRKALVRQGVKVLAGTTDFGAYVPAAEKVLLVTGRRPVCETLNLEAASISYSKKGIAVNEYLETPQPGVFAAGDVNGNCCLAYTAQMEGITAAENAFGRREKAAYEAIPRVVFGQPPASSVGLKEADVPGRDVVTGRFPFTANSRAFIAGERTGWVKVIADAPTGLILGGCIYGHGAEELITILSLALRQRMALQDLRRECFFHPSLSEAVYGACEDALQKCVDLPLKKR